MLNNNKLLVQCSILIQQHFQKNIQDIKLYIYIQIENINTINIQNVQYSSMSSGKTM